MTLTRSEIRGKAYTSGKVPGLGWQGTASDVQAQYIVDTFHFQDGAAGAGDLDGASIYIPSLAGTERVKRATEVITNKLYHEGSAYTSTGSPVSYELVGLIDPDQLNDCIRRAQRRVYFETYVPVTPWLDGDFASGSMITPHGWTAQSVNAVSANSDDNRTGIYSLEVTNSAAGGYTRTSELMVNPGDRLFHGAINRADGAYTAVYRLWDTTNNREIGEAIEHSSRAWQTIRRTDTIPEGCYSVRAQLEGAESNAVIIWDTLFGHELSGRELGCPSFLNEPWQLLDFMQADYARQVAPGRFNADSIIRHAWYNPDQFKLEPLALDSQPRRIQATNRYGLPEADLWLYAKRPHSDQVDMISEILATSAPEDLIMAAVYAELGLVLWLRYQEPRWMALWKENEALLEAQKRAKPQIAPTREKTSYNPAGRARGGYL